MTEMLLAVFVSWCVVAGCAGVGVAVWVRRARRRARADVERLLDGLSERICTDVACGREGRAQARLIARYDRGRSALAAARTTRELKHVALRIRTEEAVERLPGAAGRLLREVATRFTARTEARRLASPTAGAGPGQR